LSSANGTMNVQVNFDTKCVLINHNVNNWKKLIDIFIEDFNQIKNNNYNIIYKNI